MKKYLIAPIVLAFIPSIAFAAWWNPLSWGIFSSQSSLSSVPIFQLVNTTSTAQNNFAASTTTIVSASSTVVVGSTTNLSVLIHKNKVKKYIPAPIIIVGSSTQTKTLSVTTTSSTSTAPSPCLPDYRYSANLGCISANLPIGYVSSSNANSSNQQNEMQAEIMAKNNVGASTTSQFNYVNGVMVPIGESTGTPNYASQDPCDSALLFSSSPNCVPASAQQPQYPSCSDNDFGPCELPEGSNSCPNGGQMTRSIYGSTCTPPPPLKDGDPCTMPSTIVSGRAGVFDGNECIPFGEYNE